MLYYYVLLLSKSGRSDASQFGEVKRVLEIPTSPADDERIYNIVYKTL